MTVYQPKNIRQVDGSRFQFVNCGMASGATLLDRHTLGKKLCTGAKMRSHQFDQSGGTDLNDLDTAWRRGHGENLDVRMKIPWNDLIKLIQGGRAMELQIWYGSLGNYRWQKNFSGNHGVEINQTGTMVNSQGHIVAAGKMLDPLGTGSRWVPLSYLKTAAGNLQFPSGRRVGYGYAYAGLSRRIGMSSGTSAPKPAPGSVPTLILTKPPTPPEVNPMIPGSGLIRTSSHVMALKKGQPLYRTPGGAVATKMSADGKVEYFGTAGSGWRCVEVGTGAAYKDGVQRPTLVYVPAAAGPITKK